MGLRVLGASVRMRIRSRWQMVVTVVVSGSCKSIRRQRWTPYFLRISRHTPCTIRSYRFGFKSTEFGPAEAVWDIDVKHCYLRINLIIKMQIYPYPCISIRAAFNAIVQTTTLSSILLAYLSVTFPIYYLVIHRLETKS